MTEEIIIDGGRMAGITTLKNEIKRLEQENKELYENGQIEITKLCNEKTKYRSALEEIRNYCDRIEQGSVIGTQDCLINSIKNIANEVLQ